MGIDDTKATIAQYNIKAVLWPADDRFTVGEPFHVGNATHGGVSEGGRRCLWKVWGVC